jgi:predicted ArsR family transcriptional regulator
MVEGADMDKEDRQIIDVCAQITEVCNDAERRMARLVEELRELLVPQRLQEQVAAESFTEEDIPSIVLGSGKTTEKEIDEKLLNDEPAERRVVEALKKTGAATTARTAEETQYSYGYTRRVLSELNRRGLVEKEVGVKVTPEQGRPPFLWRYAP